MNYYALFYEVVDDFVARRAPFRQEHLRLANEARERGEILLAGALADPADRALIVFHVDDKTKVESFARKDPYVQNGLVKKWEVRPWNVVVGNEPLSSSSAPRQEPSCGAGPLAPPRHNCQNISIIFPKMFCPNFAASPATWEPRSLFAASKTKSKSWSKPTGVPSTLSATSPAPTSKPPSSLPKPPRSSPA